ncbi:MAG: glycosyltransferase [Opitutales bacterium]
MRALLTTYGSTGDVYPVIALARALEELGHEAVLATMPAFQQDIEAAGVNFAPMPPTDWGLAEFRKASHALNEIKNPLKQLETIYAQFEPFFGDFLDAFEPLIADFDIVVGSYLLPNLKALAHRHGKPFAALCFCHNVVPSSESAPPNVPPLSWLAGPLRRRWNRSAWSTAERILDKALNQALLPAMKARGLPAQKGWITAPGDRVLVTMPESLFASKDILGDERFVFTGYLRWQPPGNEAALEAVEAFTKGEAVPVITFGSMAVSRPEQQLAAFLRRWPKGAKLILQSGWAGFEEVAERPEVHVVGKCSHNRLFEHASVVVHHGGAGTTASALWAGKPQILVPHIADQPFWAREMERLGVGRKLARKRWTTELPALIASVAGDAQLRLRASSLSQQVQESNGPEQAVRVLEAMVRTGDAATAPAMQSA